MKSKNPRPYLILSIQEQTLSASTDKPCPNVHLSVLPIETESSHSGAARGNEFAPLHVKLRLIGLRDQAVQHFWNRSDVVHNMKESSPRNLARVILG
jgi:hypothetical protein